MKNQPELVGKIILAKFLEYSMERFIAFVSNVESSPLYKKLVQDGVITPKSLAGVLRQSDSATLARAGVIGQVEEKENLFLYYTTRELSEEYQINDEKLKDYLDGTGPVEERGDVILLLNKLRRINTRNLIVHRILETIVEYQRDYFASNNEFSLKPLSRAGLARLISGSSIGSRLDFVIDTSRISRAVRNLSIITPGQEVVPLSFLFVSEKDIVKKGVKAVLNREKKDLGSERITKPYTDEELRGIIKKEFGLSVTRREVSYCRKELGILPCLERNGYVYQALAANFSPVYPFTMPSVEDNAPSSPGVYELRTDGVGIEYPTGYCQTFYIGSAKNLRKRLLSHLSSKNKNGGIKSLVEKRGCVFRYLQVTQGWDREEKRFYNLFVLTYGDSPQCNHMSPKVSEEQRQDMKISKSEMWEGR